jgi:hypothetical protein
MRAVVPVLALLAAVAAQADPAPAVTSAGARPGEALICHYFYSEGMLIRRPICKTERQWIRARLQQQAGVFEFQQRALVFVPRR